MYDEIRKEFYKKRPDEELQDILYRFKSDNLDLNVLSNAGFDASPILNTWIDDLLYKAKRIDNTLSPDEAIQDNANIDKIIAYIRTNKKFFNYKDESECKTNEEYIKIATTAIKTYFRNSRSNIVNASKVANFSPNLARKIYEKYCPSFYATILDYSCGWGARMLGCLSSPYEYRYIGIEPNSKLNERLHEFSEWICNSLHRSNNTKLYLEGSEVFHEELVNTIDLSFSSPPYFNLEIYCNEETQSANENTTLKSWFENYMVPTIQNIYKYTKVGGYHIVNLKNISSKEPLFNMWTNVCEKVGFEFVEYVLMEHQSKRQFNKNNENVNYHGNKEPIAVFKKVS